MFFNTVDLKNQKIYLHLYKTVNIKLNDCLIWSFMEKDDQIVSFDKDFDKLPRIKRVEPKDLLV